MERRTLNAAGISLAPEALVARIAALQSTGNAGFPEGLFPTERTHPVLPYAVPDDTVFPTAAAVYTLQQLRPRLGAAHRATLDAVTRAAVATYPAYRNNEGQNLYNFWVNVPEARFFPNGRLLSRFRQFHLPEDIDTTAYVYLTQEQPAEDVTGLRRRLLLDTNGRRRWIRNTRPRYRRLRAYSTWLGQANRPIDFDVCALSNLLLFIFAEGFPRNAHDDDSLRFIAGVIETGDHWRHPFEVAPWYGQPVLILYHVARLVAAADVPILDALRPRLVADLRRAHAETDGFVERCLCATSLSRLGHTPPPTPAPATLDAELDRFHFFGGSILTPIDNPVTWALARRPFFQVRYRCPAHTLALLLEYVLLAER